MRHDAMERKSKAKENLEYFMWRASLEGGSRTANVNSRWWRILCLPFSKFFGSDCLDKSKSFDLFAQCVHKVCLKDNVFLFFRLTTKDWFHVLNRRNTTDYLDASWLRLTDRFTQKIANSKNAPIDKPTHQKNGDVTYLSNDP